MSVKINIRNKGKETVVLTDAGENLKDILQKNEIYLSAPCGGKGTCGKCKVRVGGEDVLACQITVQEDLDLEMIAEDEDRFDVVGIAAVSDVKIDEDDVVFAAIDIGTTTLALSLVRKKDTAILCTRTGVNHQRSFGGDVVSRMQASNEGNGSALRKSVEQDLWKLLTEACDQIGIRPGQLEKVTIAGNTTMGHLLLGFSCETLGVSPFTPVDISTITKPFPEVFADIDEAKNLQIPVILLPGITTYVGADIVAGLLVCGFDEKEEICAIVDLGTNGEMAIGNKDKLLVTSTAAGPAFEGGKISCGMGGVPGAICHVTIDNDAVPAYQTIANEPAIGICGTGVIEVTAELLKQELIDETGMLDEDYFDDGFVLAKTPNGDEISFTQKDVREIQLAKSAVRAGLETLLLRFGATYDDIDILYIAGGFGYKIDQKKAIEIGLLPEELSDKIQAIGNSSLTGAVQYGCDLSGQMSVRANRIAAYAEEISLAKDKDFNEFYMDYMYFE